MGLRTRIKDIESELVQTRKELSVKQSDVLKAKQELNALAKEHNAMQSKHVEQIKSFQTQISALNTNINKLKKIEKETKAKLNELKNAEPTKELKKCKKE